MAEVASLGMRHRPAISLWSSSALVCSMVTNTCQAARPRLSKRCLRSPTALRMHEIRRQCTNCDAEALEVKRAVRIVVFNTAEGWSLGFLPGRLAGHVSLQLRKLL